MQSLQNYYYFIRNKIKSINLSIWFYIFGIGIYSLTFAYITGPARGVDEIPHFFRALQISQGNFFPTRYENNNLGGELDTKATAFATYIFSHPNITTIEAKKIYIQELNKLPNNQTKKFSFSSSASYSPLMYLPSATGLFLSKIFHANADTRYFAGRIANVISYVFLLSLILLILPIGRYFTLLFLSMPTSLQMAGSYNADTFTNLLALLFIACCLRSREITSIHFHKWKIIIYILAACLGLLKITYCFLSLFCLFIPSSLFQNKKNYIFFCITTILLSLILAIIWNTAYPFNPGQTFNGKDNPSLALHILITHPFQILHLISHTLHINVHQWYSEIYGTFINNNIYSKNIFLIKNFSYSFLFLLLLTILLEPKKQQSFYTAIFFFIISLGYALLVILAFYINFSPIGSQTIQGLQGRYFILAIIPAILGFFYCLPQKIAYEKLLPLLLIINFFCLTHVIIKAFVIISN